MSGIGTASLAAAASGGVAATSTTPTTAVQGEHFTRYCVNHYAPNSDVSVTNNRTGDTGTIHTDATGHGCTQVPVQPGHCQTITASGTAAAGGATSSSSTVCVEGLAVTNNGSTLPFTGANDVVPMTVAGVVLIGFGGAMLFVARRKRGTAAA